MNRRDTVIALLALGTAPFGALAQPSERAGKAMRVGMLFVNAHAGNEVTRKIFVDALRELGWVESRNIIFDSVYADNDESRLPALAAELVVRAPDLIWVLPLQATLAALASTRTIPIVFAGSSNVVERGLVKPLARPGGNVTGVQNISLELGGKRLQLLKQALPKIARVGVLVDPRPDSISLQEEKVIKKAAATLDLTAIPAIPAMAKGVGEFDAAIASLVKNRVEAVLVTTSPYFNDGRKRLVELTASRRLPVVGFRSEFADDGALMSYSALLSDQVHRSAQIVDKILKGAKPADIPVEQPTKFEMVVNLRTAKALGLVISPAFLARADRVIQ